MKTLLTALGLATFASLAIAQEPIEEVSFANGGKWEYTESIDPFTDQNNSMLILYQMNPERTRGHEPNAIAIGCVPSNRSKKGFVIIAASNGYITSAGRARVTYRFGDDQPISESWTSRGGRHLELPGSYNDFIKNLRTGKDFIFGIYDYNGGLNHTKFDNALHPKMEYFLNGCK